MKLWSKSKVKKVKQLRLPKPEDVFPQAAKPARPVKLAGPVKVDEFLNKLTPEARAKLDANALKIQEILTFTEEHPEEASTVLRAWLVSKGDR